MTIGEKLKNMRTERSLKQKDIAELLNIMPNAYSQYETNSRIPNIFVLMKLADFYKCGLDYMMSKIEIPK